MKGEHSSTLRHSIHLRECIQRWMIAFGKLDSAFAIDGVVRASDQRQKDWASIPARSTLHQTQFDRVILNAVIICNLEIVNVRYFNTAPLLFSAQPFLPQGSHGHGLEGHQLRFV
jgi:hypothetical protein